MQSFCINVYLCSIKGSVFNSLRTFTLMSDLSALLARFLTRPSSKSSFTYKLAFSQIDSIGISELRVYVYSEHSSIAVPTGLNVNKRLTYLHSYLRLGDAFCWAWQHDSCSWRYYDVLFVMDW